MITTPAIEAVHLQKQYGKMLAVKDVSLTVAPGEIFGFLGPNGAGKTTTIKMLVGLLHPSAGVARIAGFDLQRQPMLAKAQLGYVPDQPNLPEKLTAREYFDFMAGLYRLERRAMQERSEELMTLFNLSDRANDLIGGFSHGMRQKTALIGALLHEPRVFFLDEPIVGLDPRSARTIKDLVRTIAAQGSAVFLSTHILEIAERMCDRVAIINGGHVIASGTVDELRTGQEDDSLEDIFLALTGSSAEAEVADALLPTNS
jgi:ABC-2 type transport system ATP-binding protein